MGDCPATTPSAPRAVDIPLPPIAQFSPRRAVRLAGEVLAIAVVAGTIGLMLARASWGGLGFLLSGFVAIGGVMLLARWRDWLRLRRMHEHHGGDLPALEVTRAEEALLLAPGSARCRLPRWSGSRTSASRRSDRAAGGA